MINRLGSLVFLVFQALKEGHRPIIPSDPMMPVPKPKSTLIGLGLTGVALAFWFHIRQQQGSNNGELMIGCFKLADILPGNLSPLGPSSSVLLAVFVWDRFLGNALLLPISLHPVVLVGRLITFILGSTPERFFQQPLLGFFSGFMLWSVTLFLSLGVAWSLFAVSHALSCFGCDRSGLHSNYKCFFIFLPWFAQVYIVKSSMNLQLLCSVALQVADNLEREQIQEARCLMPWLVSRDCVDLRPDELAGATLESLAENLSDSFVSPLCWYVLCGPFGAFAFKVINTLDSRVGYHGRFEWVGKPSARIDDVANLVPARLTATLLIVVAYGQSLAQESRNHASYTRGANVAWTDACQCDSPNAGWPMAAMAGILNVNLEKRGQYSLNSVRDGGKAPSYLDIRRGHDVAQLAGIFAIVLAGFASSSP